mmetsp:Transcript_163/g.673  ORF Transcript_163/g.673 Transcript_163/m.673 type:complete len:315 (+) Transcript_163:3103-4047(+)
MSLHICSLFVTYKTLVSPHPPFLMKAPFLVPRPFLLHGLHLSQPHEAFALGLFTEADDATPGRLGRAARRSALCSLAPLARLVFSLTSFQLLHWIHWRRRARARAPPPRCSGGRLTVAVSLSKKVDHARAIAAVLAVIAEAAAAREEFIIQLRLALQRAVYAWPIHSTQCSRIGSSTLTDASVVHAWLIVCSRSTPRAWLLEAQAAARTRTGPAVTSPHPRPFRPGELRFEPIERTSIHIPRKQLLLTLACCHVVNRCEEACATHAACAAREMLGLHSSLIAAPMHGHHTRHARQRGGAGQAHGPKLAEPCSPA